MLAGRRAAGIYLFHAIDVCVMNVEERAVPERDTPWQRRLVEITEETDGEVLQQDSLVGET